MLGVLLAMSLAAAQIPGAPVAGVSEALARERAAVLRSLSYDLSFVVPLSRTERVQGRATIRFTLSASHRVVLDFAQPASAVHSIRANGRAVAITSQNGHLIVPAAALHAGTNEVSVEFLAGDDSLNRNDEFLYTLFVPSRAQLAFPCFDQPDLKARYRLVLEVPAEWKAVANGAQASEESLTPGRRRVHFAETQPLPTYLFAFVAGKFEMETAVRKGRELRMFHRETDAAKVARNRDAIFDLHAAALEWLEQYTGIPYAFGKFDVVLIPSFQFSGMEHAGAILYNASSLFLEESATQTQKLDRASVIAHETSHMWFGDLVTMRWFDDVWMKEVFANFMAAKIVNPSFPDLNHGLRFLMNHYPTAYQVDRTEGTNPIRQELANLNEAGQLYGPIIYQKAPIVMRQLELMLGENELRDGLRVFLNRYSFGNATWLDLIRLLDARTPKSLTAWSGAWVEQRGRPRFDTGLQLDPQKRVRGLTLTMTDPLRRGVVWPQKLRVAVGVENGGIKLLDVDVSAPTTTVSGAVGLHEPRFVLPNGEGLGYGLFVLDSHSRDYLLSHIEEVPDAITRGSAWVTLWDNMLEERITPAAFFAAGTRALALETDEQNAERVLGYLAKVFWRFLPQAERVARAPEFERLLKEGLSRAPSMSLKATWFNALRDTALGTSTLEWLERVWRREEGVPGLPLAETDEIVLAEELAVRDVPHAESILREQLTRTQNPDRKARFAFVSQALSHDASVRQAAFDRLRDVDSRRREPWVIESLHYLNHPLREASAVGFVRPALELLQEVQRTGDIFFPSRWMESTLYGHRSAEVAGVIRAFLAAHPRYPTRLRWTILAAADETFRAARLGSPRVGSKTF